MRVSFTICLVVLAIVLGGLAVVHTGEKYRDRIFGSTAVAKGEKLFDLKELDRTRAIVISNTNDAEVRIEQTGHFWSATEPWADRVDPLYVRTLFQFAGSLVVQDAIDRDGLDLRDFGLREGSIRLKMLDSESEETCDIWIGRKTAWKIPSKDGKLAEQTIFIRRADRDKKDKIYICTSSATAAIHSLFSDDFARFRDHHPFLLHFNQQYLDKVSIQNGETEIVVSRPHIRSGWRITKPNELHVDPEAVRNLLNSLAELKALKAEDRSRVTLPTAADGVKQAQEVSIHFAGEDNDSTLRIYPPMKDDSNIALATVSDRPDTVFHLPLTKSAAIPGSASLSFLQTGVNDLRSKTMTHMNGRELKTIIIRPGGLRDILLQRTRRSEWRILEQDGWRTANTDTLVRLITAVTQDKIVNFVTDAATELAPYGLNRPMLLLGFNSFGGDGIRMAIGRGPQDGKLYARILGRPNIWEISSETFGKIALYPWQWRTAHVWHIPAVDVEKIVVQRKGKPGVELTYAHFADKWTASLDGKDATTELNPNRAKLFLKHLGSLEASRWIGPMHPAAMKALESPDTVVRIHVKRFNDEGMEIAPAVKTLKLAHTPGGLIYFAKVDTQPAGKDRDHEASYFNLSPEAVTKLYVDLFE